MHGDPSLPIHEFLPAIVDALQNTGHVIIAAPPGAGKTTAVPPALLDGNDQKILLLQPRRMAARSVAARLAHIMGGQLGREVGYQVRMEKRWTLESRIVVMTYGVLLRRLQSDPMLEGFGTVLLDEFHERFLEADLALGMLTRVRSVIRDDLRLGIMSATLDVGPLVDFMNHPPVVETLGRTYPLKIEYIDRMRKDRLEDQVADVLPTVLKETTGHVLVFLPGLGEIRRTAKRIAGLPMTRGLLIEELYGDLPPEKQDAVLQSGSARKIVLATNVAETSITIPGVTGVIDSGLARVSRMNPSVGLPRLDLEPISQASANQRAGRAGRTAPGVCYRLWMKAVDRSRPEFDTPEILRGDLASAVLQLYGWGEANIMDFPWLTPPKTEAVDAAVILLERLGAIEQHKITPLGRDMLAIPAHPRLARMMISGSQRGIARRTAICASMLSERDPFIDTGSGPRISKDRSALLGLDSADLINRAERMEQWIDGNEDPAIQRGAGFAVKKAAEQLLSSIGGNAIKRESKKPPATSDHNEIDSALATALLEAFPDRLAKLRQPGSDRGLMVGGQGVRFKQAKLAESDLYLCIDLLQKTTDADVRLSASVGFDLLSKDRLRTVDECFFHPSQKKVVGRRRLYWLDLMLEESPTEILDDSLAASILISEVRGRWERAFPGDDKALVQLLGRIRVLNSVAPDEDFPIIDQAYLQSLAAVIVVGKRSIEEVRAANWGDHLKAKIGYQHFTKLENLVPATMTAPSGNQLSIDYSNPDVPALSVRLQELFGWTETPRVAGKRMALLLRILAPNYREVQVTSDLANFWRTTYHDVRKELRRRYPKHHWPEDPLTASASRSGLNRDAK